MDPIKLTPVTSSQIEAIGHDEPTSTLAIKFRHGGVYHYQNFPHAKFVEFATAASIGSYFYAHIKQRSDLYPYEKQP